MALDALLTNFMSVLCGPLPRAGSIYHTELDIVKPRRAHNNGRLSHTTKVDFIFRKIIANDVKESSPQVGRLADIFALWME